MKVISRRDFGSRLAGSFFGAALVGVLGASKSFAKAAAVIYKTADLAETKKNPSIAALKYVGDAAKKAVKMTKMGVTEDKQFCNNCNFYKEPGKLDNEKGADVGKCLMLGNQVVHGKGWCNVWTKKA